MSLCAGTQPCLRPSATALRLDADPSALLAAGIEPPLPPLATAAGGQSKEQQAQARLALKAQQARRLQVLEAQHRQALARSCAAAGVGHEVRLEGGETDLWGAEKAAWACRCA